MISVTACAATMRARSRTPPNGCLGESLSFDGNELPEGLKVVKGDWVVKGGKLWAVAGAENTNRTILISHCKWKVLRLDFDVTLHARPDGRVGDIEVILNADPVTARRSKGYSFITAQYWNQATVCYRLNIPIARTEYSPIVPGAVHRIAVGFTGDHLRFWIDGIVVLDVWDRDSPIPLDPERWIALSTYDTTMSIDNLVIRSAQSLESESAKR